MLYSKETITVFDTEQEVSLYLKRVRNHSFRISANKISMTLPDRYKHPDTIQKYKQELLDLIKAKLEAEPKWLKRKNLFDNEFISIFNQPFRIVKNELDSKNPFDYKNQYIYWCGENMDKTKTKLIKSIILHFEPFIDHRVRYWNQLTTEKTINQVRLKNNLTTWGLCSNRGEITISVHTLFTPLWVMDYVIIHELCHLIHHDHSQEFWQLVEKFYPKYKLAKKFLVDKGVEFSY